MSLIALPKFYRVQVQNQSGVTLAANAIKVRLRRVKFDSAGALEFDIEDEIYDFGSTLADNAFAEGTNQDNTVTAERWLGADVYFQLVFPSGVDGNPVIFWLQYSTDDGTTFVGDGEGDELISIPSVASSTIKRNLRI